MGKASLDEVTKLPNEQWRRANCLLPAEGHVYLIEIRADGVSYTYKIRVKRADWRAVDFEWAGIGESRKAPVISPFRGKNGVFGTFNEPHSEC